MFCQFQVLTDSVLFLGGGVGGLPWWLRCLENSMDRESLVGYGHEVTKSWT